MEVQVRRLVQRKGDRVDLWRVSDPKDLRAVEDLRGCSQRSRRLRSTVSTTEAMTETRIITRQPLPPPRGLTSTLRPTLKVVASVRRAHGCRTLLGTRGRAGRRRPATWAGHAPRAAPLMWPRDLTFDLGKPHVGTALLRHTTPTAA